MPDPLTGFFCPTEADRERLVELEAHLRGARLATFAALGAGLVCMVPWIEWRVLPLAVALLLGYELLLRRRLTSTDHAAAMVLFGMVLTTTMIAVGAMLTGGATSPLLPWMVIPIMSMAGRFDNRGVWTGTGFAIAMLAAVAATSPRAFLDRPDTLIALVPLVLSVGWFSVALMRAERLQRQESALDPLTGLLNRKSLEGRFGELAEQARLTGDPVALLVLDLDHFKAINDTYGHALGDAVLRHVAASIRGQLRSFELAYRLGGEEFLVVLPGLDIRQAAEVGERLRRGIEELAPNDIPVTISVGVSAGSGDAVALDALFAQADAALYAAKGAGRNRVQVTEQTPELRLAA
ncbi:MAG TPA: GGDEF domain-containing protein [Capillimicrobium sp.]|nr:GGDEF domain-containing protein [Capillimicrobium sp.]